MLLFLKGAGVVGSLLVIIALVITLLKVLIGFVGFLALAIKIIIVLAFLALFCFVGMALFRAWQDKQRTA
jgi:hypothetical protein